MASAETLRLRQAVYERHGRWLVLVMLAVLVPLEVWNFIAALFGNRTGFRYLISLLIPLVIIRNITGMWLGNPAARKTTALFLGLRCLSYVVALVTLVPVFLKPVEEIENRPASDAWLRMMLLFLGPMLFFLLLHLGFALLVMYSPGVKAFVNARCRRGPFYVRWPKWLRSTLGEPSIRDRLRFSMDRTDRLTYQTFSDELITVLDDVELDDAVMDHVAEHIDRFPDKPIIEVIQGLPVGFQVYYSLWWLRGEIENGGFFQFFVNKGVDLGFVALEGCKRLHRPDIAIVLIRAIELYLDEEKSIDAVQDTLRQIELHPDWAEQYKTIEATSSLRELNKAFFNLPSADLWSFLRNNKHLFQAKEPGSDRLTS